MRAYGASRAELLAAVDAPALKPMPAEPYAFAEWKICRVALDYHVEIDGSWYSVPYRLIREQVDVRASDRPVEIFHKGRRVASHARSPGRRGHTTIPKHMPSSHRRQAEWTPARLMASARKIGPAAAALISTISAAPDLAALSFEERVGIMADREAAERDTKRLVARLKFAALRQDACVEDIAQAIQLLPTPPGPVTRQF
jgi:transposase